MSAAEQKLLITHFKAIHKRLQNLIELSTMGEGNYDRFKDTGIVHPETARSHGALGVSARASTLSIDERQYDPYYV